MVVGDHVFDVREQPSLHREVDGEKRLLGPGREPLVEAADSEKGFPADDSAARDEAKDGRAGQLELGRERASPHLLAGRVVALLVADEHVSSNKRKARVALEHVGRVGQRARQPPGVVVAERGVGSRDSEDSDRPGGRTEVPVELDDLDVRKGGPDGRSGAVGRAVVDDDDVRVLGKRAQSLERLEE